MIAGPCSIENEKQMDTIAKVLSKKRVGFLRGGAYKPRTSPYDFQGMGIDGLKLINKICKKYSLISVSEILDVRHLDLMTQYIDVLQVGSRSMYNIPLLKEIGKTKRPVILKRGMSATLNEFLLAAEYIVKEGNDNVVLCERGIRTFEDSTRNTLDISSIAIIKKHTNLSVIADISHSLGRTDIMIPVAKALIALGIDGIMVEVHDNPPEALSDSHQQLSLNEFSVFLNSLNT